MSKVWIMSHSLNIHTLDIHLSFVVRAKCVFMVMDSYVNGTLMLMNPCDNGSLMLIDSSVNRSLF
jgi:hypothetical protein